MDFQEFFKWIFYGLMGGVGTYGVYILNQMKDSVEKLNINVAVVIERTENHEKRLDRLENR
jgi:hypothetical protein